MLKSVVLLWGLVFFATCSCAETHKESGYFGAISQEPIGLMNAALNRAQSSNNRVLMVIGADWCHDSRALAEYLEHSEVKEAIARHYELVVVNAGWLKNLSGLLGQFGHPVYFGTPTVWVIDPNTNTVINFPSVQRWQSAHSESPTSLAKYLRELASTSLVYEPPPGWLTEFENLQAQRLYDGYAVLGPLLQQESNDGSVNADELWQEVRRFRYQLQHDLVNFYTDSNRNQTQLPDYPPMSFE